MLSKLRNPTEDVKTLSPSRVDTSPGLPSRAGTQSLKLSGHPTAEGSPGWRLGQRLEATVTGQSSGGRLHLQIGGRPAVVQDGPSLPTGTRLQLQVTRLADPPTLQITQSSRSETLNRLWSQGMAAGRTAPLPPTSVNLRPDPAGQQWLSRAGTGQTYQATVTGLADNGGSRIRIGGQTLVTEQSLRLPPGSQVTLRLVRGGEAPTPQVTGEGSGAARIGQITLAQDDAARTFLRQAAPGKIVQASVEGPAASGGTRISIGEYRLRTEQPLRLPAGTRLEVAPRPAGDNISLQVIQHTTASPQGRPEVRQWARLLQHQLPALAQAHPSSATQGLQHWLSQLPTGEQLTRPERLKQAMGQSGPFLEAALSRGAVPEGDLKLALLRLKALLTPLVTGGAARGQPSSASERLPGGRSSALGNLAGLLQETESRIGRIQASQSQAVNQAGEPGWSLNLEVPFLFKERLESLRLGMRHAGGEDEREEPGWRFSLSLDLEELGPLTARLSAQGQRVGVAIWAERETTLGLVQGHLGELEARLRRSGFEPGRLDCYPGTPPEWDEPESPRPPDSLIFERA